MSPSVTAWSRAWAKAPAPQASERHDFGNAYVLPGAIDAQVHSRSQKDQEDFIWSTRSAAAGGVTTIVDMPYDEGNLVCTGGARAAARSPMPARRRASISRSMARSIRRTAPSTSPTWSRPASRPSSSRPSAPIRSAFRASRRRRCYACFTAIARAWADRRRAQRGRRDGARRDQGRRGVRHQRLSRACPVAPAAHRNAGDGRDLRDRRRRPAARRTSCIARSAAATTSARPIAGQGFDTTIECCIHYLTLDEENDVKRLGGKAKINPPIRPRAEVEELWRHLAAGNVTRGLDRSRQLVGRPQDRSGHAGECLRRAGPRSAVPLLREGPDRTQSPVTWAARLLAANPARLFRIDHRKGALEIGRDADIVVMAHEPHRYDRGRQRPQFRAAGRPIRASSCLYRPVATFLRGQMVFDGKRRAGASRAAAHSCAPPYPRRPCSTTPS